MAGVAIGLAIPALESPPGGDHWNVTVELAVALSGTGSLSHTVVSLEAVSCCIWQGIHGEKAISSSPKSLPLCAMF